MKLKFEYQRRIAQGRGEANAVLSERNIDVWKATLRKKKRKCGVCKVNGPVWKFCTECGCETCDTCSYPEWVNALWPTEFPNEVGPRLLCLNCKLSFKARKRRMKGKERKLLLVKAEQKQRAELQAQLQAASESTEDKKSIQNAIDAIEVWREMLGDEATDAALSPLLDQLEKVDEDLQVQRDFDFGSCGSRGRSLFFVGANA